MHYDKCPGVELDNADTLPTKWVHVKRCACGVYDSDYEAALAVSDDVKQFCFECNSFRCFIGDHKRIFVVSVEDAKRMMETKKECHASIQQDNNSY